MAEVLTKDQAWVFARRQVERGGGDKQKLLDLIAKGWKATYAELFGQNFVDSLDSEETDDTHHSEAIEWHWESRLALLQNKRPDYFAYFPIWARGNFKSGIAETMVVVDAILSVAYGEKGYCLYIGREKDRVKENIGNLEALLSRKKIKEYAPELSEVALNEETNSKRQWTGTFLYTKAGYIIKGGTIDSAQAGSRIKHLGEDSTRDTRVTFFVPDDIDTRDESPVITENRFNKLTTEILPMKQENTLTFFAQNLISRYSVMYRIQKGGAKVLTNRKPTEPIPAVRNLVTEQQTFPGGIIKDVVVSGQCTWRVWNLARVQDEIDTMGLSAFLTEMQHEVEQSREGLIHKNYHDDVHPISYSQFASVYGSPDAWKDWHKVPAGDWAVTKTKYHANVAGFLSVSSQNTKLPGMTFLVPFSFPKKTEMEDVAERLLNELTPYAYDKTTWRDLINDAHRRTNETTHFNSETERRDFLLAYLQRLVPQYSRPVLERYNVKQGVYSHSESTKIKMLNHTFGFSFIPSNPRKTEALDTIDSAMRYDMTMPHCFDSDKMGYARWYVLCADDETQPFKLINGIKVFPPKPFPDVMSPDDLHDDDLFRFQMMNRRFRPPKLTELGETIGEVEKLNDDFGQMLQMVYLKNLLKDIRLTKQEQIDMFIPEPVREAVQAKVKDDPIVTRLNYEFYNAEARRRLFPERDNLLDGDWE